MIFRLIITVNVPIIILVKQATSHIGVKSRIPHST